MNEKLIEEWKKKGIVCEFVNGKMALYGGSDDDLAKASNQLRINLNNHGIFLNDKLTQVHSLYPEEVDKEVRKEKSQQLRRKLN